MFWVRDVSEPGFSPRLSELAWACRMVAQDMITPAVAIRWAGSVDWTLTDAEAVAAREVMQCEVRDGDLRVGNLISAMLLALASRRRGQRMPHWNDAAFGFLGAAAEMLAEEPDGILFGRACVLGAELIDETSRSGDPQRLAAALFSAGELRLEPYAVDPTQASYEVWQQSWRARQIRRLGRSPESEDPERMPDPGRPLAEAAKLFGHAAELLEGQLRGRALAYAAYAKFSAVAAGETGVEFAGIRGLCREALSLVVAHDDPLAKARLCWMVASRPELADLDAGQVEAWPVEGMVEQYGIRQTVELCAIALQAATMSGQAAVARQLLGGLLTRLPADRMEPQRHWVQLFVGHCLEGDPTTCREHVGHTDADYLWRRMVGEGWDDDHVPIAALHALLHLWTDPMLLRVASGAWSCSASHADALRLAQAGAALNTALAAMVRGENAVAVLGLGEAVVHHALAQMPELAVSCLDMLYELIVYADDPVGEAAVGAVSVVANVVFLVDESAQWQFRRACVAAMTRLSEEPNTVDHRNDAAVLHQATKGWAFAAAQLRSGQPLLTPDSFAPARIAEVEARVRASGVVPLEDFSDIEMFDEEACIGAFLATPEMQAGRDGHEVLANLQRAYQREDTHLLLCQTAIEPVHYRSDSEIRADLPGDTVLVSLYVAGVGAAVAEGFFAAVYTCEDSVVLCVGFDRPSFEAIELVSNPDDGFGPSGSAAPSQRIRYSNRQWMVSSLRRALRRDPLHRVVARAAEQDLADTAIYFEPLLEHLDGLRRQGKRHLCIWPHEALHFLPFHLLPVGGRLLADDWTVTVVPSLVSALGTGQHPATRTILAIGSPEGGVPYGLPAEPAVADQAKEVAAAFGTTAAIGADATAQRLLNDIGHARYVHIAAHGGLNVPAPAFHCLYLTGGRVFAHEILARDLRGVQLVTLSACQSALLRYDANDNLYGLPAAFLRAGAAAVLGCLWPVRAEVAGLFFQTLYQHLAAGHGKLAAYSAAQNHTRQDYPEYRDWAAFSLLGDWRDQSGLETGTTI